MERGGGIFFFISSTLYTPVQKRIQCNQNYIFDQLTYSHIHKAKILQQLTESSVKSSEALANQMTTYVSMILQSRGLQTRLLFFKIFHFLKCSCKAWSSKQFFVANVSTDERSTVILFKLGGIIYIMDYL